MIASPVSLHRIGWLGIILICCALLFGLSLKVNALKSQVRQTENRILALKRETMYLETEYETRSSQQQLASWNAVEFGYAAPGPGQYLENVRQLAELGKPRGPDAPAPIRVASAADDTPAKGLPALVSPLTGRAFGADEASDVAPTGRIVTAASLGDRLGKVEHDALAEAKPKATTKPATKPAKAEISL